MTWNKRTFVPATICCARHDVEAFFHRKRNVVGNLQAPRIIFHKFRQDALQTFRKQVFTAEFNVSSAVRFFSVSLTHNANPESTLQKYDRLGPKANW